MKSFQALVFGAVFWCFGASDFEKFSSPFFWGGVLVVNTLKSIQALVFEVSVLVFQTLKSFRALVFGAVFWCFGVSDNEKFPSPCFWGGGLVFWCFRF